MRNQQIVWMRVFCSIACSTQVHRKGVCSAAGSAGAYYSNYKSRRGGTTSSDCRPPPDFENTSFRSLFSKCAEESFSSTTVQQHASYSQCFSSTVQQHASYSQTTTAHVKRCESFTVLDEAANHEDAADWEGRLQESIRVVFSYEQKGLLAIGTFALDEVSTLATVRNLPAGADELQEALSTKTDATLEMHKWLQETRVLVAKPNNSDITMQRSIQVYNADTLEDNDTNIAAAQKAHEGLATMTIYQAPLTAEEQAVDRHQNTGSKKDLSRSIMRRPDDGQLLFQGLRKQVFPLPPNCWPETLPEFPIYARAPKPKDFSAYTTSLACGLFSANSFRKFRKMWLRDATPHRHDHHWQQHKQPAALCNRSHVGDGQEMVSSSPPAKDMLPLAKKQPLAARGTANCNQKGKQHNDGSHRQQQQHCECSNCKQRYMMDLCRYVNRKLRRDYNIPEDEPGHWITTDSEYLILEM